VNVAQLMLPTSNDLKIELRARERKNILDRRAKGRAEALGKDKGKYTEETAAAAMETA